MKTNRILIGALAFVIVVAIATSGYMLGYANAQTKPAAQALSVPVDTNSGAASAVTSTPVKSAANGSNDAQAPTANDKEFKTFW